MNPIFPVIYELTLEQHEQASRAWRMAVRRLSERWGQRRRRVTGADFSAWCTVGEILMCKLCWTIFPVSDFRHTIVTSMQTCICEALSSNPVLTGRDLVRGLMLVGVLLESVGTSAKVVPEGTCVETSQVHRDGRCLPLHFVQHVHNAKLLCMMRVLLCFVVILYWTAVAFLLTSGAALCGMAPGKLSPSIPAVTFKHTDDEKHFSASPARSVLKSKLRKLADRPIPAAAAVLNRHLMTPERKAAVKECFAEGGLTAQGLVSATRSWYVGPGTQRLGSVVPRIVVHHS